MSKSTEMYMNARCIVCDKEPVVAQAYIDAQEGALCIMHAKRFHDNINGQISNAGIIWFREMW